METHNATVVPGEEDEMTVYVGTQGACEIQSLVADILGVPMNKITVVVKRLGALESYLLSLCVKSSFRWWFWWQDFHESYVRWHCGAGREEIQATTVLFHGSLPGYDRHWQAPCCERYVT